MKIYIVEKEMDSGDDFWETIDVIPCINKKVAEREMKRMIGESSEGEFEF